MPVRKKVPRAKRCADDRMISTSSGSVSHAPNRTGRIENMGRKRSMLRDGVPVDDEKLAETGGERRKMAPTASEELLQAITMLEEIRTIQRPKHTLVDLRMKLLAISDRLHNERAVGPKVVCIVGG